jgi:hypothetical protein
VLRDDARQDRSVVPNQWTLITAELVHPFEAVPQLPAAVPDVAPEQASMPLTDPEVVTIVERICGVLGVPVPRVLISGKSGHACAPGLIRIGESGLTDYAGPDREALLAHCCGHLLLPHAGELSADRVAALYQGSADAITRVIFADAVHSGAIEPDPAVRVREIQAWSATSGFARLVTSVATAARP